MKSQKALFVSLFMGLFAVMVVHLYVKKKESDMQANAQLIMIYTAAEDIPEMVRIKADMVKLREVPASFVLPQATTDLDQIIGAVAKIPIFEGSQIAKNMLISRIDTDLAMRVDPLRRAMAIAVSDVTGVAGLIKPGNSVDIYATFKIKKKDYETIESHLLLTNVRVLAVERKVGVVSPEEIMTAEEHEQLESAGELPSQGRKQEYPKNITLSVTSEEAIRLITAQEAGFLTAVLRPQYDEPSEQEIQPVRTQDLIGQEKKTSAQKVPRYEQIRGSEISY